MMQMMILKKKKKEVSALLRKAFNDPELYIKTNRTSFAPTIGMIEIPSIFVRSNGNYIYKDSYLASLPRSNNENESISIYEYLEKNAVDCVNKEGKELLKEINGEVNHKGDCCLLVEQSTPANYVSLNYGKLSKFEMHINSIIKGGKYSDCNYYIKYFDNVKDLIEFLNKNIIEKNIVTLWWGVEWRPLDISKSTFSFRYDTYKKEYNNLISQMDEIE